MDQVVARLAVSQGGLFTRRQARDAGLSAAAVDHRLHTGRWTAVTPRVYRLAGVPETDVSRLWAVLLSAGPGAAATATTALALCAIRDFTVTPACVTIARRPHRLALAGVTETFWLPDTHRTTVHGVPSVTVARALFDLARTFGDRRLARAVDRALAARAVTVAELRAVVDDLAERGRKGAPALRRILDERADGAAPPTTALESRFLELVLDHGLPEPDRQVAMTGRLGWIGTVDFAWPAAQMVVETDGGAFHDSVTDREDDERRDRALEAEGWIVLRFNWNDVTRRPTSVVHTLRRARWRPWPDESTCSIGTTARRLRADSQDRGQSTSGA